MIDGVAGGSAIFGNAVIGTTGSELGGEGSVNAELARSTEADGTGRVDSLDGATGGIGPTVRATTGGVGTVTGRSTGRADGTMGFGLEIGVCCGGILL